MRFTTALILFTVIVLGTLSVVLLFSFDTAGGSHFAIKQTVWFLSGIALCLFFALTDYQWLRGWSWVIFGGTLLILGLVFVPGLRVHVNGASRWVNILGFQFQPSSFAKLGLIICLAHYISLHPLRIKEFVRGILWPTVIVLPVLVAIFLEPDISTTLLVASVAGVMLVIAGVRIMTFAPLAAVVLVGIGFYVGTNDNRMNRVRAYLSPEEHRQGAGEQAEEAIVVMGIGGLEGVGIGEGIGKLGSIPEQQTDFIFSVVGEELGLIGSLAVSGSYVILLLCGVTAARNAKDNFGTMLAVGISFMIAGQAFMNMGVVTRLLPNTGICLPFVSYSGSSMLMMMSAAGILVSVSRQGARNPFEMEAELQRDGELPVTEFS